MVSIAENITKEEVVQLLEVEEEIVASAERTKKEAKKLAAKVRRQAAARKRKKTVELGMTPLERVDAMSMSILLDFSKEVRKTFEKLEMDYIVVVKSAAKSRRIVLRVRGDNTEQKYLLNFMRYILTESTGSKTTTTNKYAQRFQEFTSSVTARTHRDKSFIIGRIKCSSNHFLVRCSFSEIDTHIARSVEIQDLLAKYQHETEDTRRVYSLKVEKKSSDGSTVSKPDLSSLI